MYNCRFETMCVDSKIWLKKLGYISLKSWYTLIGMALRATTMLWFTSPVDHWSVLPH